MKQYLTLLQQRPHFRYLWLAAVVSLTGDWFNTIASVILVNRYTDSGTAIGALFLARTLPPFLLSPVAGVVADRFNRKATLFISDILRAITVLGFLLVDSREEAWLIYALTLAQFVISSFFEPAKSAILPSLLSAESELLTANTLSSATWSAMLTLGAAMGGLIAAVFGVQVALIIDAATFLLSAFFILKIAYTKPADETAVANSGWRDFIDGLQYVRQRPRIGRITLVKAMGQLGSPDIMIAVFAAQIFVVGQDGAASLGLMYAFSGIGAVIGPLLANLFNDNTAVSLQRAITWGFIAVAAGWLIFGASPILPLALIGLTIRFMGGSVNWTYSSVLLQMSVPDRFLGRVFALDFAIYTLMAALSVWLTGVILDETTASPQQVTYLLAGISLLPVLFWTITNHATPDPKPTATMTKLEQDK